MLFAFERINQTLFGQKFADFGGIEKKTIEIIIIYVITSFCIPKKLRTLNTIRSVSRKVFVKEREINYFKLKSSR